VVAFYEQNKAILNHSDVSLDILIKMMNNLYKRLRDSKKNASKKEEP